MMQACFFPLTLTMILLLFFCDATVVLWYFGFLFSIAMLGAAFALILLPRHSDKFFGNQPFPAELVLYAGVAALMICIIAAYIKYQVSTVNSNITQVKMKMPKGDEFTEDELVKAAKKKKSKRWYLIQVILISVLMFTALFLNQSIKPFGDVLPAKTNQAGLFIALGGICILIFTIGLILRMLLKLCHWGRLKLVVIWSLWIQNFILVLFVAMSSLYIPIVHITMTMWACFERTCHQGSRFISKLSLMETIMAQTSSDHVDLTSRCTKNCCEPCDFLTECPIMSRICPEDTERRLHADESLSCPENIDWYFGVAAGYVTICFVIGVPVMYLIIIKGHCEMLGKVPCEGDTPEDQWLRTMSCTDNSAKSLYEMYERKWRYYKLLQVCQKMFLVVVTVLMWNMSTVAVFSTSGVHATFFVASAYSQPYIATATDLMATLCMFCDLGTSMIGLVQSLRAHGTSVFPDMVWPIIGGLQLALPIGAACAGGYYSYVQYKIRADGQAKRDEMLKLKEDKDKKADDNGDTEAEEVRPPVPLSKKARGRGRVQERRAERAGAPRPHPIFLKVSQNRRRDVENFLMEDGIDPNTGDSYENTPLHYACLEGHKAIVKTLLRFGAEVNVQNRSGNTALHVCFAYKRDAIADYLLEKGGDPTVRNNADQDPYMIEGEKLPEFANDLREDKAKPKKKWDDPNKKEKKGKGKVVKKGEDLGVRAQEALAEQAAKKAAEEEEAAEAEAEEEKDEMHYRIAAIRKLEADNKIVHWANKRTMAIPEVRATVDRKLNEYTIKVLSRFFLATGALTFMAFGFSLVGLLYGNQDLVYKDPVRPLAKGEWQMFEFLDYGTWPAFASHCCCKEDPPPNGTSTDFAKSKDRVELWFCDNGFRKQRLRETQTKDAETGLWTFYNGSKLRPFCGRSYPKGYCPPAFDPDKGRFKVRVCNISQVNIRYNLEEFDVISTQLW